MCSGATKDVGATGRVESRTCIAGRYRRSGAVVLAMTDVQIAREKGSATRER
jgi:hypothetical protein